MKSSCARVCSDRACGEGQGERSKKREGRGGSPLGRARSRGTRAQLPRSHRPGARCSDGHCAGSSWAQPLQKVPIWGPGTKWIPEAPGLWGLVLRQHSCSGAHSSRVALALLGGCLGARGPSIRPRGGQSVQRAARTPPEHPALQDRVKLWL